MPPASTVPRAATSQTNLVDQRIRSKNAGDTLRKILDRYRDRSVLLTQELCGDDVQMLHRQFQFQFSPVEGTLAQKMEQYGIRKDMNLGVPDELTLILGSFNIYAAINRVEFSWSGAQRIATVTHIYLYVKDGFTFTDRLDGASQYLGHWGRKGISIVFAKMATSYIAGIDWVDYPVVASSGRGIGLFYPVKNSDFREWQIKHRRGGDYMIYTNMKSVFLAEPLVIVL